MAMELILKLSGDNISLACEEALAVLNIKRHSKDNNLLFINTKNNCFDRLAYTKSIYQFIFKCQLTSLKSKISRTNWKKYYQRDYCARAHNLQVTEKELGSLIWPKLSSPKVNLTDPKTLFEFIKINNNVYCGKLIWVNNDKFEQRKAHLRPELHPTSLHPKLARAMVNLSRIKKRQVILDPFMGSGGILIEAGLIGCKIIGNDIDRKIIEKAEQNLKHYGLKAVMHNEDAARIKAKADAIVTDLPYGRSSFRKGNYGDFINNAHNILKKNHYLIIGTSYDYKPKKFRVISKFLYYIHQSLTKHIMVLKKV
jgi:tRNA (guanine10-N2)-dimethyltransferase